MAKTCIGCGHRKPDDAFYRHARMKGGRLNRCIECVKAIERTRHKRRELVDSGMTEEQAMARLGLSAVEKAAVRHCVQLYTQARDVLQRNGRGTGKGRTYKGKVADAVLSRVAPDFERWCVLTQALRDVVRIRNGELLCRAWNMEDAA